MMDVGTLGALVEIVSRIDRQTCEALIQACRTRLARIADDDLKDLLGALPNSSSESE